MSQPRNNFVIPNLDVLLEKGKKVCADYKNEENAALAKVFKAILEITEYNLSTSNTEEKNKSLHQAIFTNFLFVIASINNEEWLSGNLKKYFGYGSSLRKELMKIININDINFSEISPRDQLIFFNQFYQLFFSESALKNNDNKKLADIFQEINEEMAAKNSGKLKKLNFTETKEFIYKTLQTQLVKFINYIICIENGIPTQEFILEKMSNLALDYQEANEKRKAEQEKSSFALFYRWFYQTDPSRIFYSQLSVALAEVMKEEKQGKVEVHSKYELDYDERMQIGLFLYIVQAIYDSYHILPTNSSMLNLGFNNLNITDLSKMPHDTKIKCLSTFMTNIADPKMHKQLESASVKLKYEHDILFNKQKSNDLNEHDELRLKQIAIFANDNFLQPIEAPSNAIADNIKKMLCYLESSNSNSWPISSIIAKTISLVWQPIGYSIGWVSGAAISRTDPIEGPKRVVRGFINAFLSSLLPVGVGTLLGRHIVDTAISRASAKAVEGIGVETFIGGVVGLPFDLTLKLIKTTLGLMQKDLNSIPLKSIDWELILAIKNLPDEVFTLKAVEHIQHMNQVLSKYGPGFFATQNANLHPNAILPNSMANAANVVDSIAIKPPNFG